MDNSTSGQATHARRPYLLPSAGNVLFTLIVVAALIWASKTGALSLAPATPEAPAVASSSTIPYQGRLANASGAPLSGQVDLAFKLYATPAGGSALWSEPWSNVAVTEGLFNVLLGSTTPITSTILSNSNLWLGISVESDPEMTPRIQLGAAPFAIQSLVTQGRLRGLTPTVYSDHASPETSIGIHRWIANGDSVAAFVFKVPNDYLSGDLVVQEIYWEHDTGTGTTAKMTREIARFNRVDGSGNSLGSTNADYLFGTTTRTFNIPAGSFAAGDLIRIQEIRNGDDATDTGGRLDLIGVGVEYWSK